ncbi:uncharacterized protein EV420DRAFT_1639279 [Desarmillaria tabescens]|uniref:Uncharacterized protein n=1 Tax=Armillaria tabescens TaxID=1929756 RepID=A0AA39NCK9_ARMTA|nr:uncharacterized protein EV420DRAFT_1639279 [Desarmillaria tabescens]KAK0463171.1 hypothetical protein EV420DRAFT_1639279 [Desarmillaria tabescens]
MLVTGSHIRFDEMDVPPTKPFRYASNIQKLISSWDDASSEWGPPDDHPIHIQGHPIPIKHWKVLYKNNKAAGMEWHRLKNSWNNWHYFMERYQSLTQDAFWEKYTDPQGQRMSYTRIINSLRNERKDNNAQLVKEAKGKYGDDQFSKEFAYQKGKKKRITMRRESDIAQMYCQRRVFG